MFGEKVGRYLLVHFFSVVVPNISFCGRNGDSNDQLCTIRSIESFPHFLSQRKLLTKVKAG